MWSLFRRPDPVKKLWKWFSANHHRLREDLRDDEAYRELLDHLKLIDRGLTYEIVEDEFVVSADGLPELIDTVRAVVAEAPQVPGWRISAFRKPHEQTPISVFDWDLSLDNVYYSIDKVHNGVTDLVLYLPGIDDENSRHFVHCAMLLLESRIGEYAVMTEIGEVEFEQTRDMPPRARRLRDYGTE